MPVDASLVAEFEGPSPLEVYTQAVERNPNDFDSWTKLLKAVDPLDIITVRKYYDKFLTLFPLCYGYWKKYSEQETKHGNIKSPETLQRLKALWERAVELAPYCVDIWIYYLSFATFNLPGDCPELFKKAVSLVGTDPKSGKIWDSYIMFEDSRNSPSTLAALYKQLLSTPFKDLNKYWDSYMAFASQQTVEILATEEELKTLDMAFEGDEANRMKSDEDKRIALKQMLIDARKAVFDATLEKVKARMPFEKKFKRLYFHVKAVGQNDIANWHAYLNFEMLHGDINSITALFERCLIACALYEEFWVRYVEWSHIARGAEASQIIVSRCLQTFLPESVKLMMIKVELLEEQGDLEATKNYLDTILSKNCPELLEAMIFNIEFLLRHADQDGAEELMEQYSSEDHGVEANAFLIMYMCNYYWKVRKDVEMARSVFTSNKDRCQQSAAYWNFFLNFEYSTSTTPDQAMAGILNDCLASTLPYTLKLEVYQLYIQYASTICTDIADLIHKKGDYAVWKLSVKAEQTAEEERTSQKREAAEMTQQQAPVATQPAMQQMGAMPQPNTPEYAQYVQYYQQYNQYYGMNYGMPQQAPQQ